MTDTDWGSEYTARLGALKRGVWSSSETAQKAIDAARISLTPKEKEVYLRTRRNTSTLTAEDLGSTEEVLDALEEKGWVLGDFDIHARVKRYWRLPNWKDDTGKGNGYDVQETAD